VRQYCNKTTNSVLRAVAKIADSNSVSEHGQHGAGGREMRNIAIAVFALVVPLTCAAIPAEAAVQYVKVCSLYGAGFFYIPGTDTCLNPNNGEVRTQTAYGTLRGVSTLAGRVGALEGNVSDLSNQIATLQGMQLQKGMQQQLQQIQARFDADFRTANDGSAIGMALQDPYLTGSEHFGFKVNWGTYSGSNALGVTFAGVLAEQAGTRLTLSGGTAFTSGNIGGHAGLQVSW
jgi:hypothetical protein